MLILPTIYLFLEWELCRDANEKPMQSGIHTWGHPYQESQHLHNPNQG